jgi:hypothetical protein
MKRLIFIALPVCLFIVFSCQKEYSLETGVNSLSTGTLKDSFGDCKPIVVNGSYTEDQPLTSSNFVTVTVDVAAAGTYKIFSDTMNGFWFVDSGFFAAPGSYTVTLQGGGKPILGISTDFTVSYGGSFCDFTVGVGGGTSGALNDADTAWMFNEGTSHFQGHIDSAVFSTSGGIGYLTIYGENAATDTTFYVELQQSSPTAPPASGATYTTGAGTAVFEFQTDTGTPIYDSRQTDGSNMTFTIVSYNAATKVLDGTFSGTAKDNGGATKTITLGKLKLQTQ